ncbi:MAG TPA: hypothetical protein VGY77_00255 [Gemmataceae bacterium]|jgi:hypothetical protein|nr:hypothetical protein [Gemmataceae bacterium]
MGTATKKVRIEALQGSFNVKQLIQGGIEDDVHLTSWNISGAAGTFSDPTSSITRCYLQNQSTLVEYDGIISYPAPGQFQAGFQLMIPQGTYIVIAVGNDGSRDQSPPFKCSGSGDIKPRREPAGAV